MQEYKVTITATVYKQYRVHARHEKAAERVALALSAKGAPMGETRTVNETVEVKHSESSTA